MHHFFVDSSNIFEGCAFIDGDDYNHIKNVLRMKVGEKAVVSDPEGGAYECHLAEIKDEFIVMALDGPSTDSELPIKVTLYQGLPKGDKLETIIQKSVELGAYSIVPVAMKRSIVKLDEKKAESKVRRWQAISESAAKQSGRGIVPEIGEPVSFAEALATATERGDKLIVPYEEAEGMDNLKEFFAEIAKSASDLSDEMPSYAIFIGPEGGFDETEIEEAKSAGASIISLGKRILRTETAGPAILSAIMLQIEMNLLSSEEK